MNTRTNMLKAIIDFKIRYRDALLRALEEGKNFRNLYANKGEYSKGSAHFWSVPADLEAGRGAFKEIVEKNNERFRDYLEEIVVKNKKKQSYNRISPELLQRRMKEDLESQCSNSNVERYM